MNHTKTSHLQILTHLLATGSLELATEQAKIIAQTVLTEEEPGLKDEDPELFKKIVSQAVPFMIDSAKKQLKEFRAAQKICRDISH